MHFRRHFRSSDCEIYGVRCDDAANMLQRHIFSFSARKRFSRLCQVVAYGRLKTIENFKQSSLKVVGYERWSPSRGSIYSDLLENFWYFGKVVANERWSLREVRL